jgi:hypothetical protein
MIQKTNRDTTIDEIHRTRQQMAEKFGDDIGAILEDARKRQEASGRAIWQGPSSATASTPAANKPT